MISDTSPEAERVYWDLLRAQSPEDRIRQVFHLNDIVRSLEVGVLRLQNPNATDDQIRKLVAAKRYGSAIAEKMYATP